MASEAPAAVDDAPETVLEQQLLDDPAIRSGLAWGLPRHGHPEGHVGAHVSAMLRRIPCDDPDRAALRALSIVHDAAKATVRHDRPWSPDNDHAVLARRFAARHTDDERLLDIVQWHDEPYWLWRNDRPRRTVARVLRRMPDPGLFARFVELDAASEGKDLSFLWWFQRLAADLVGPRARDWSAARILDQATPVRFYAKEFMTTPETQQDVTRALARVATDGADLLRAVGDVRASEDGLRALLTWRFAGDAVGRVLRDGAVVRAALRRAPILRAATAVEARLYRAV